MGEIISFGGLDLHFLQTKEGSDGGLDLFEMTVQPASKVPAPHYHENWDETIYGIEGESTWRIDGSDVTLRPGDTLFIRRGIVHSFRNDGAAPTRCLCILTPGVLGPGYFREMATVISSGSATPATIKDIMLRHGLVPVPAG
jgi:quercetin dioxygenase-like cupin family protein